MLSLCELSFTYSLKFADSSEHRSLLTTIGPAYGILLPVASFDYQNPEQQLQKAVYAFGACDVDQGHSVHVYDVEIV
jgi:hypothetical protein